LTTCFNFEDEARLNPLAREFRAAFRRQLAHKASAEEFTDRLVVTIPALHPETGNIVVWLDDDEVTVGIGEHFHCHFETYVDDTVAPDDRNRVAAERAVEFIGNFMSDSIVLRVEREGGRVASAGTFSGAAPHAPPGPHEIDYLWSGPRLRAV
jgi:hypothetical protein